MAKKTEKDVLEDFCRTIEATGGVLKAKDGALTVVGDEDWIDLALHYMEACKVLGRKPKVRRSKEETF